MACLVWQPRVLSHSALHGEGGPCCFRRDASEAPYALLLLGMPAGVSTDPVTRERSSAPSSHQAANTASDPHVKTPVVKLHGASLQSVVVLGERRALTKRDDTPPVTEISHFEKALDLLV